MMAIPAAVWALATGVVGLVKPKKAQVVWYLTRPGDPKSWVAKSGPMSARQCRKTITKLVATVGLDPARLEFFRKGVDPNKIGI